MYSRVDDARLTGVATKGVLLVFALKVVYAIHALFIKDDEPLVARPPEAYDLRLVPLFMHSLYQPRTHPRIESEYPH